jgi:hypothetical protein
VVYWRVNLNVGSHRLKWLLFSLGKSSRPCLSVHVGNTSFFVLGRVDVRDAMAGVKQQAKTS